MILSRMFFFLIFNFELKVFGFIESLPETGYEFEQEIKPRF